jgi:Sec-independent protein translocase protein TatA
MLGALLQPSHLILLAVVCLFFFGGKLFANLGKGFATGIRNFKDSMRSSGKH